MPNHPNIMKMRGNTNGRGNKGKRRTNKRTIVAYAALCPGTEVPMAEVGNFGRYFVLLCDPNAKEQAERMSKGYPPTHQKVIKVTLTYEV